MIFLIGISYIASRNRPIAKILITGYIFRSAFVFFDDLVLGISKGSDGYGWNFMAQSWAKIGLDEIFYNLETGPNLYKVFMALMYYLFGNSTLMIQMVNAFFGTLVVLVVWRLARILNAEEKSAYRAAWIVAVFPSTILHSGMLLREVAVTLPLTIGVYYLANWHKDRKVKDAILAGLALMLSMAFHSGGFAVILALSIWVTGSWIKTFLKGQIRMFLRNTVALILVSLVVVFAAGTGWGMKSFSRIETADFNTLTRTQQFAAIGRTAYLEDLHAETSADLALQLPVRFVYFLFAPFPWMIDGLRDLIGFADSILFFGLICMIFLRRRIISKNANSVLVIAVFLAMAFTFSLGVSNYGTAFRHRNKMLPMLIAVSAVVMFKQKQMREPRKILL